jgi:hypothetical protein
MSDIFREVDEEVKRDKVAQFFKKHSTLIGVTLILLVVGVGAFRFYTYTQEKRAAEAGRSYEQVLQLASEGKDDQAKTLLDAMAKESPAGYRLLARFRLASDLSKTDIPGAVKAFEAIAEDTALENNIRDLAKVRAGLLLVDTASFDDLAKRLEPFAAQGQTWRITAREALGVAAYKAGDMDKASKYFDQILSDSEVTQTARQRAEMMLSLLRGGAVQAK